MLQHIKISYFKNEITINSVLFFLCIGVTYLNNYKLTLVVWFLSLLLTLKNRYSITIIKSVAPYAIILLIASVITFFNSTSFYLIIRDLTYLIKPILGLILGYQLLINDKNSFKLIVFTGFIIAIIHLLLVLFTILGTKSFNVNKIREVGGYFSDFEVYVIIILMFFRQFGLNYSLKTRNLFLIVVCLSCFLYLSRTNFIQFIIFYLAVKGYLLLTKKSLKVIFTAIVITLISYSAISYINPKRQGDGIEAFLYKIKIAPIEAFKTKINKNDWKDFNDNYRSYENIITVKQVSKENFNVAFGKGLGSTVNLGRRIKTNDGTEVQFIPILHNGFTTVFLKSGLLGVCFLIYFIFFLYNQKMNELEIINFINYLLIGTSVFLIVSNWVFMGLYLKLDNKSILIGFLIALRELILKGNKYQQTLN